MKSKRPELEEEWKKVFNTDLPKYIHKTYAIKYMKWHKENTDFNKSLQNRIAKLVENYEYGNSAFTPSVSLNIKNGTKLIRDFRGTKYEVIKTEYGYDYNGKTYKSLSAIANEITGTRWNGKKFFGLIK